MKEFFYSSNLYDAINNVVINRTEKLENNQYFNDALEVLYKEYENIKTRNVLLGPLNKDLQEFDVGFLTKRPFTGFIGCNPAIKHLQVQYGLNPGKIEENYNINLMSGRNSLGAQIDNFDISSYFPVETKDGLFVARCLKWGKHDISLSMLFSPEEYSEIIKSQEYTKNVCRLDHMKVFKILMHKLEIEDVPYSDRFYDSL